MLNIVDGSVARTCVAIILLFLLVAMFFVATISNTLIVILFIRRRGMRTIPHRFVLNLAAVNLVSALVLVPLLLADMLLFVPWPGLCQAVDALTTLVVSASVLATLLIAGDRYTAVTDALRYHAVVTKPRSLALILACWLCGSVLAALSALVPAAQKRWETCPRRPAAGTAAVWYSGTLTLALFAAPLAAMVWMYAKIYLCAHKNSERKRRNSLSYPGDLVTPMLNAASRPLRTQSLRVQPTRNPGNVIVNNLKHKISNASLFMYREEGRTAKVSFVVIIIFFVCWLPFFLSKLAGALVSFSPSVVHTAAVLVVANSAVSPFVYSFRSRRTQRELRRLLGLPLPGRQQRARPLRRTLTNPSSFQQMDTIPHSPLELKQFDFPPCTSVPPPRGFLFPPTRRSSSLPSVQRALASIELSRVPLFTFAEGQKRAAGVPMVLPGCDLPRCSISSDSSEESQQSACTDQTDVTSPPTSDI